MHRFLLLQQVLQQVCKRMHRVFFVLVLLGLFRSYPGVSVGVYSVQVPPGTAENSEGNGEEMQKLRNAKARQRQRKS